METHIGEATEEFHAVNEMIDKLKGELLMCDSKIKELKEKMEYEEAICSENIFCSDDYTAALARKCYFKLNIVKLEKERPIKNRELAKCIRKKKELLKSIETTSEKVFEVELKKSKASRACECLSPSGVEQRGPVDISVYGLQVESSDPSDKVAKIRLSVETPMPSTSGWVPKVGICKLSTSGVEQRPVTSSGVASGKSDPSDKVAKIRLSDETPMPSTSGWVPKVSMCKVSTSGGDAKAQ